MINVYDLYNLVEKKIVMTRIASTIGMSIVFYAYELCNLVEKKTVMIRTASTIGMSLVFIADETVRSQIIGTICH